MILKTVFIISSSVAGSMLRWNVIISLTEKFVKQELILAVESGPF